MIVALLSGVGLLAVDLYGFSLDRFLDVAFDGWHLYIAGACAGLLYTLAVAVMGWWGPRKATAGRLAGFSLAALASASFYVLGLQLPMLGDSLAMLSLALAALALVIAAGGFGGVPGTAALAAGLLLLVPAPVWLLERAGSLLPVPLDAGHPAGLGWGLAGLSAMLAALPGFLAATAGRGAGMRGAVAAYSIGLALAALAVAVSTVDPRLHSLIAGSPEGMLLVFALGILAASAAAPQGRGGGHGLERGSPAAVALGVIVLAGLYGFIAHEAGGGGVVYNASSLLRDPASSLPKGIAKPVNPGGAPEGILPACSGSEFTVQVGGESLLGCVEARDSSVYINPLGYELRGAGLKVEGVWGAWLNGSRYAELASVEHGGGRVVVGSAVYAVKALGRGGVEANAYVRVYVAGPSPGPVVEALEALTPEGALEPPAQDFSQRLLVATGAAGLAGLALITAYAASRLARGGGEGG